MMAECTAITTPARLTMYSLTGWVCVTNVRLVVPHRAVNTAMPSVGSVCVLSASALTVAPPWRRLMSSQRLPVAPSPLRCRITAVCCAFVPLTARAPRSTTGPSGELSLVSEKKSPLTAAMAPVPASCVDCWVREAICGPPIGPVRDRTPGPARLISVTHIGARPGLV